MKIFDKLFTWFFTRNLKCDIVYKNKEHKIAFMIDDTVKIINLYVNNRVLIIPFGDVKIDGESENKSDDISLDELTDEELNEYLKFSEEEQDFETCVKIIDTLNKRTNENKH
jgi:hypothetical protein